MTIFLLLLQATLAYIKLIEDQPAYLKINNKHNI